MDVARATLYYDDDCGFCRRMTRLVLHLDHRRGRRLRPKSLQHPEAHDDLSPLTRDAQMASWHLRTTDGVVFSGGAAFAELARTWDLSERLVGWLESNARFVDRAYVWVAKNRVPFGRLTRWMPDLPETAKSSVEKNNPPA